MCAFIFTDELFLRLQSMPPERIYRFLENAANAVPEAYQEEFYRVLDTAIDAGILTYEQIAVIQSGDRQGGSVAEIDASLN